MTLTERSPAVPIGAAVWTTLLGLTATVAGIVRVLERPEHATRLCVGSWLALAGAVAIFAGAWVWILTLTLIGLALSAWIRWRVVASGALAGVFFMGSAFGEMWKEILGTSWGRVTNLSYLVGLVWRDLFGVFTNRQMSREMFNDGPGRDLPTWAAWAGLMAAALVCVWILDRRLRAREVVS